MNTTPTPPAIHRITPDCYPKFPCWLWDEEYPQYSKGIDGWSRYRAFPPQSFGGRFTHWSPDALTVPTQIPNDLCRPQASAPGEIPGSSVNNPEGRHHSPTPAQSAAPTPEQVNNAAHYADTFCSLHSNTEGEVSTRFHLAVMTVRARTLEIELAAKDAEIARLKTDIFICDSMRDTANKDRDQLRAENTKLRGLLDYIGGVFERGEDQIDLPDLINAALSEKGGGE